jgi:hypothetical protein
MSPEEAMMLVRTALLAIFSLSAVAASAQTPPAAVARATIESVAPDGASLMVKTRDNHEKTVKLSDKTSFTMVVPATLADVKPDSFIGVAALPDDNGGWKAMEVHIFPEAMRGMGEGHRPFDLAPGSSMTNGAVSGRVDSVDGAKLTVTYKGGHQAITVSPGTPIVAFAPGAPTDLKSGASVIVRGQTEADGSIDAARILVGKDGLVPPM